MILPKKHISMSASLMGLGAIVLKIITETPLTIDGCWETLNKKYIDQGLIKKKHSFDNLILTIDLLYMLGVIKLNKKGELVKL